MKHPLKENLSPHLLAYAMATSFRGVQLIGGGTTPISFYYDFIIDNQPTGQIASILEEKLRHLFSHPPEIRAMEMVADNGADLLKHHHQPFRAEKAASSSEPTVHLVKMGSFYDLVESEFSTKIPYKVARVIRVEKGPIYSGEPSLRVVAVGGDSQSDLKQKSRQLKDAESRSHVKVSDKELFEFTSYGPLWHPRGEAALHDMEALFREAAARLECVIVALPEMGDVSERFDLYRSSKSGARLALYGNDEIESEGYGLFGLGLVRTGCFSMIGDRSRVEQDFKALQRVLKEFTAKFLFETEVDSLEFAVGEWEICSADAYGADRILSRMEIAQIGGDKFQFDVRLFESVETWIALMIEKKSFDLLFSGEGER